MQTMNHSISYLEQHSDAEPTARAELAEIADAYLAYINLSLGFDHGREPETENDGQERWNKVRHATCIQQNGDTPRDSAEK